MPAPKLPMLTKLAIVAVFVLVGLIWLYVGSPAQRFRMSEEEVCRDKCAQSQKSSRLVSHYPKGMVGEGKYDGPWSCECY